MKESKVLNQLLQDGDIVVFACSGGPDSMCLLDLLEKEKKQKKITLICAHVNHKKRKESEEEYIFVKNYCEERNIIFEGTEFTNYKQENFHAQSHQLRKEFFEQIIKKYHAKYLMTAHHGDDLMETILMRINRGSSFSGYAGFSKIQKEENYTIVRPLITATKSEIKAYNDKNNIPYVLDQSNDSDKYTRNRYRHSMLPFLKSENKNAHLKFLEFHEKLCRINEFLVKITEFALTDCIENDNLHIVEFKKYDSLIQREILQKYLYQIYQNDIVLLKEVHIDNLLKLLNSSKSNGKISLPKKKVGIKNYQEFKVVENNKSEDYFIELKDYTILPNQHALKIEKEDTSKSNYVIRLNSNEIKLPLFVRTRKVGDQIATKNLKGHQKLKNILIDKKIPTEKRSSWPVVVDTNDTILWIPGLKKSKFDKEIDEKYDIIVKYILSEEKDYVTKE